MNAHFVRRSTLLLGGMASVALLAACGDKRIRNLDTGITRDSALTVLAQDMKPGGPPDSLPNVYYHERFLIDATNYEVMYYKADNEKAVKDTVFTNVTPVVFIDNKLIGFGWSFWDSVSTAKKIPLKKRD